MQYVTQKRITVHGLIRHYSTKVCRVLEVQTHVFLTSVLDVVSDYRHSLPALPSQKCPRWLLNLRAEFGPCVDSNKSLSVQEIESMLCSLQSSHSAVTVHALH
jgi:hypothetical protein